MAVQGFGMNNNAYNQGPQPGSGVVSYQQGAPVAGQQAPPAAAPAPAAPPVASSTAPATPAPTNTAPPPASSPPPETPASVAAGAVPSGADASAIISNVRGLVYGDQGGGGAAAAGDTFTKTQPPTAAEDLANDAIAAAGNLMTGDTLEIGGQKKK